MRATCLNCHRRLPANDVVEAFPFGRRVAYDPEMMRLWVVCMRCGKWNLAPVEADERASTIDLFERWWRGSVTRYSAGGIGLGRYNDRFFVVRVGAAAWNDFAGWRYARVLRKRRYLGYASQSGTVGMGAVFVGTGFMPFLDAMIPMGGLVLTCAMLGNLMMLGRAGICRIPARDGGRTLVRQKHLPQMELVLHGRGVEHWTLNAEHDKGLSLLTGEEALRALVYVMPHVNEYGATEARINDALCLIGESGGPEGYIAKAAQPITSSKRRDGRAGMLGRYPPAVRVALEIATQEQQEVRALENELVLLRNDWLEAEEIADIASKLLPTVG